MGGRQSPVLVAAGCLALALVLPVVLGDYMVKVLTTAGIYVGLALSLNLITGVAGQFNLGHAAFYGAGAYTAALLAVNLKVAFLPAILAGAAVAAVLGLLLGLPAVRLRDIYLAVTTLGFGEIVRLTLLNWTSVTRGPMGIPGIPYPSLFGVEIGSVTGQYYLMIGIVVPCLLVLWRLTYSPFGMVLRAVRENEVATRTLGIHATAYKLAAFSIGAGVAGLLGGLFAFNAAYISPDNFLFVESISILAMVVVGGLGSFPGVFLGALILSVAPEGLRFMHEYRLVVFGLLMLGMVLVRPQGLISESFSVAWATGRLAGGPGQQQPAAGKGG